jgi:hypothetical protein
MKQTVFTILACSLFLNTVPAFAQKKVVEDVKAQFESQGVDLRGSCGAFYITNEVAKRTGLKLLKKVPGQNRAIPQPDGTCKTPEQAPGENGYAVEYLITLPSGFGYDILGDSGGDNSPRWAEETNKVDRNLKNWAEPVPLNVGGGAVPTPIPDPGTTLPNPGALTFLQQTLNEFRQEFHEETVEAKAERVAQQEFRQKVGVEYGKFLKAVAKYGSLVAGGILGGKYIFGGSE